MRAATAQVSAEAPPSHAVLRDGADVYRAERSREKQL